MESVKLSEKRIRFRSASKVIADREKQHEDLSQNGSYVTRKETEDILSEDAEKKENQPDPSLVQFLRVELTRGYLLEHDEALYAARREKVYSFMKIPREVEKFMAYGFFQCADSFLYVCTFLPMRFILALWAVISRPIIECFGLQTSKSRSILKPAEICDLLKGCILIVCSMAMYYIDTSMMYHLIKSQSVIKLYIFFNMLEVGDRLFSAFGQDTIDALFWTATEPRGRKREHFGVIPHLLFAIAYVFLHGLLVLFQATTLNVAINSNNKALLTIMMSNNFVELKGSVFKKFDKNNLFQVSCSDVRERFHLFVLLFIVVLQTMKEYAWKEERFWVLVPDCVMVLMAEVLVDWIKHAFITRFNELPVDVYREYTTSLAYDMAQSRQKHAFSDHSDLVARRMGFIPLPLGVVMVRVLGQAVHIQGPAAITLVVIAYLAMTSFRILNSIVILGKACDLIAHHQQDKVQQLEKAEVSKPDGNFSKPEPKKETCKKSADPIVPDVQLDSKSEKETVSNQPVCSLGPAAIFSNSTVSIDTVCLNEEILARDTESAGDAVEPQSESDRTDKDLLISDVSSQASDKADTIQDDLQPKAMEAGIASDTSKLQIAAQDIGADTVKRISVETQL